MLERSTNAKEIPLLSPSITRIDMLKGTCTIQSGQNADKAVSFQIAELQRSILNHRVDFRPQDIYRNEQRLRVNAGNAEYVITCTGEELLKIAKEILPHQSSVAAQADRFARWTAKTIPGARPFWNVTGSAYDMTHSLVRGIMGSPQQSRRTESAQEAVRPEVSRASSLQRSLPPEIFNRTDQARLPDLGVFEDSDRLVLSKKLKPDQKTLNITNPRPEKSTSARVDTVFGEMPNGKSSFEVVMATTGGRRTEKDGGQKGNEDAAFLAEYTLPNGVNVVLALVLDGLGGQQAGELGSQVARDEAKRCMDDLCRGDANWNALITAATTAQKAGNLSHAYKDYTNVEVLGTYIAQYLLTAMQRKVVNIRSASATKDIKPRSTVVGALVFDGHRPTIFHGGDSRCRIVDASGSVLDRTEDHTKVQLAINTARYAVGQPLAKGMLAVDFSHILGGSVQELGVTPFEATMPHNPIVPGYTQPMIYRGPQVPVGATIHLYTDGLDDLQAEEATLSYNSPLDQSAPKVRSNQDMVREYGSLVQRAATQGQDNTTVISLRRKR